MLLVGIDFLAEYKKYCSVRGVKPHKHVLIAFSKGDSVTLQLAEIRYESDWLPILRVLRSKAFGFKRISVDGNVALESSTRLTSRQAYSENKNSSLNLRRWQLDVARTAQDILLNYRYLQELSLENIHFSLEAFSHISAGLSATQSLKVLSLCGCPLSENVIQTLLPVLKVNSSIRHLKLNKCTINDFMLESILNALKQRSSIESSNNWQVNLRNADEQKYPNQLLRLDFAHNTFSDKGIKVLCNIIHDMPSLKALDLRGTIATMNSIKVIVETVRSTQHILFLDLRDISGVEPYILKSLDDNLVENIRRYCQSIGLVVPERLRAETLAEYVGDDIFKYRELTDSHFTMSFTRKNVDINTPEKESRIETANHMSAEIAMLKNKLGVLESKSSTNLNENRKLEKLIHVLGLTISSLNSILDDLHAPE